MARIAVGGFQHETNTFAPQRATWDDFLRADAWPGFVRGPELIAAVEGFNIPIAGAVKALQGLGHDPVPLCWCSAPPSSYVERDAYEKVAGWIVEDLRSQGPFDAVYLDLHGAMVAEHVEDGEGELLRRVRAVVGEAVPVVASLDFHTNMTPEMVRHASAMVGYRTYPHIDMAATGARAAELLDRLLKDRRPLYKAYRQIDFLIPLVWQCTLNEPTRSVFDLIGEIEAGGASHNQGIVSITHTPGFPPADIAQCGPALVVYGHDREAAELAADRIAAAIRAREPEFAGRLYTPDEAVAEALRIAAGATRPVVLADIQDNPGAGGTSDTVALLRALIAHTPAGAAIGMIVDAGAADWRIVRVESGDFVGSGPMYGGARFHIGPMALLRDEASGVLAVLASKRIQAVDQEMFRHVGVEPAETPILALKSTVHFRAHFQPIAEAVLVVQSPGAHVTDPAELPYRHLRRGVRLRPMGPVHR